MTDVKRAYVKKASTKQTALSETLGLNIHMEVVLENFPL